MSKKGLKHSGSIAVMTNHESLLDKQSGTFEITGFEAVDLLPMPSLYTLSLPLICYYYSR